MKTGHGFFIVLSRKRGESHRPNDRPAQGRAPGQRSVALQHFPGVGRKMMKYSSSSPGTLNCTRSTFSEATSNETFSG